MKKLNYIVYWVFFLLCIFLIIYYILERDKKLLDLDTDYRNLYINNSNYENMELPSQNDE